MYKLTLIFTIFITLVACSTSPVTSLEGTWRSNEKLTLESMNKAEGIPEDARKYFKNKFFGQLIVEYKGSRARSYFAKREDNVEKMYEFYSFKILSEKDGVIIVEWDDWFYEKKRTSTLYIENDCYYMKMNKFNEYFCRVEL